MAAPVAAGLQTIGNFTWKAKYYWSFGRLPASKKKKKSDPEFGFAKLITSYKVIEKRG